MSAAKKARGRPKLASAERATRRVVARLYASDEQALAELCERLELNEVDVIRRALQELAKRLRVR